MLLHDDRRQALLARDAPDGAQQLLHDDGRQAFERLGQAQAGRGVAAVRAVARAGRARAVRFSCRVSEAKMLRSCGPQPMPAAARWCAGSGCSATPPRWMVPACWRVAPARVSMSVVLPAPLR